MKISGFEKPAGFRFCVSLSQPIERQKQDGIAHRISHVSPSSAFFNLSDVRKRSISGMSSEFESEIKILSLLWAIFLISEMVPEGCFGLDAIRYTFHLRTSLREY